MATLDFQQALDEASDADRDGFLAFMIYALGVPTSALSPALLQRAMGVFVEAGVSEDSDVSAVLGAWFAKHPPQPALLAAFKATLTEGSRKDPAAASRASVGGDVARVPVGHGAAPAGSVKGGLAARLAPPPKKPPRG